MLALQRREGDMSGGGVIAGDTYLSITYDCVLCRGLEKEYCAAYYSWKSILQQILDISGRINHININKCMYTNNTQSYI